MEIIANKAIADSDSLVLIGNNKSPFEKFLKLKEEREYFSFGLANDKKQFTFNQFPRWIFIHILDTDKSSQDLHEEIRKTACTFQSSVQENRIESLVIVDLQDEFSHSLAFAEGLALSSYQFLKYSSEKDDKINLLKSIRIESKNDNQNSIAELNHLIQAVWKARDLVNEPLSYLTATTLSKEIEQMGQESGFQVEVFQKKKIESLRMGGLLAVNRGSLDPPTFSILTWKPENAKNKRPLVLVGKGIVYDTGGLSLKPTADSMDYMKTDMAGAAAVAGAIYALAKSKVPVYVIGLVPATDNRPDGNAYVPGDVIRMFNGKTVEVLNTDAEGRMILADALSWSNRYEPRLVLNIATLTGAAQMAFGNYGIAGMGNAGKSEFEKLAQSGEEVRERIAEMPFWDDYKELLKSDIADLKNIGGRFAGAITAGKFLEHFTDYPFIHLDIAGPSYNKTADSYRGKGGSGIGVRLLYHFIKNRE